MTQDSTGKKDTQKLQRVIVDGLEDVKAQDIQVFNTEHLSPLFERVIIASGTSNRQTKALAASVRDAVRDAGFGKPRTEGEDNGEWIIVDCGAAVAHIMQPTIRQYYHLEEIWGDKPVRLKFGAAKPAMPEKSADSPQGKKEAAAKTSLRRSSAAKTAVKAAEHEARLAKAAETRPAAKPRSRAAGKPASRAPAGAPEKSRVEAASKAPARPAAKPAVKLSGKRVVGQPAVKKTSGASSAGARKTSVRPAPRKA